MLSEINIDCPYCGERFTSFIDTSAGTQVYIEDCQVCCNPIVFELRIDTISEEPILSVHRDNE